MGEIFNSKQGESYNLEKYLECEAKLNDFFSSVDYCKSECLSQKCSKFDNSSWGRHGCCISDFYLPVFSNMKDNELEPLIKERNSKYSFHK